MAYVVKERPVQCPWCKTRTVVQTWSCGCETPRSVVHESQECLGRTNAFFYKLQKRCGQREKRITDHNDKKGSAFA